MRYCVGPAASRSDLPREPTNSLVFLAVSRASPTARAGLAHPARVDVRFTPKATQFAASIRRFVPIEEVTLSIGRASEYASSTTLVERPAHLFTKLSLRPIALVASIGN